MLQDFLEEEFQIKLSRLVSMVIDDYLYDEYESGYIDGFEAYYIAGGTGDNSDR